MELVSQISVMWAIVAIAAVPLARLLARPDWIRMAIAFWLLMSIPLALTASAFHYGGQFWGFACLGLLGVASLVFTTRTG